MNLTSEDKRLLEEDILQLTKRIGEIENTHDKSSESAGPSSFFIKPSGKALM